MNTPPTAAESPDEKDSPDAESATDLRERVRADVARINQRRFDPEAVRRRLADRAKHYQQATVPERRGESVPFLCFKTGRDRYGIAVGEVLEIEPLEHLSPVPHAPPFIRGVIQWRGTILALLDLSQLYSIAQAGIADLKAAVIVEAGGKQIAVAAGEIEDILNIRSDEIADSPESDGESSPAVIGVHDNDRTLFRMEEVLADPQITARHQQSKS